MKSHNRNTDYRPRAHRRYTEYWIDGPPTSSEWVVLFVLTALVAGLGGLSSSTWIRIASIMPLAGVAIWAIWEAAMSGSES